MASALVTNAVCDALTHSNALLKFITPNNVGLTGSHECGFYLPKPVWQMYTDNPPKDGVNSEDCVSILWQGTHKTDSRIKWYGKLTRSEYRLTRFGRNFPYLKDSCVGNLLVLVRMQKLSFSAYVLDSEEDIEEMQAALGVDVFESWGVYPPPVTESAVQCIQNHFRSFIQNLTAFPATRAFSNETLAALSMCLNDFDRWDVDKALLRLLDDEYLLFKMAETHLCQPAISKPFRSIDDFLALAASIMNRRKARAGRSLENHLEHLLQRHAIPFDIRPSIDGNIQPDVLIPGKAQYEDARYPADKLFMLALKRTCKDRWRQVLNEAKRIPRKHLLTIQPSISANQLTEMKEGNVTLVVPQPLQQSYPKATGVEILSLQQFILHVKNRVA